MSLQNVQAEFVDILLSYDENADLVKPLQNMQIYRNNITHSLINTLRDTYPLIIHLTGEDFFLDLANDYIKHYPSHSSHLQDYGEYVSAFLASYPQVKNLPYLPEVAQFEWLCHRLQFAADHPAFDNRSLEKILPDQYQDLHFVLHPASHVIHFRYPILSILELCKGETNELIDMNASGNDLLIIRRDLDIKLVSLTAAESAFLTALQEGLPLHAALDAANAIEADFKLDEELPAWIQNKTIVDVY